MSKVIKQMEMDALNATFKDVRDMVLLSVTGLNSIADNQIRLGLRKKGIRMQIVKNSLAQKVFDGMGVKITKGWDGSTLVAWGTASIAELSKEIEGLVKKYEKNYKVKTAVAEGEEITFADALKRPTREAAIARVIGLALSPASNLVSAILGPASSLSSQIKSISEKKDEGAPAAPAA
jgi:large subunit ribosomal protein L10